MGVPPTICCYSGVLSKGRMVAPPSPHSLRNVPSSGLNKGEKPTFAPRLHRTQGHKHAQRHIHSTKTTFCFYKNQVSRSCPTRGWHLKGEGCSALPFPSQSLPGGFCFQEHQAQWSTEQVPICLYIPSWKEFMRAPAKRRVLGINAALQRGG